MNVTMKAGTTAATNHVLNAFGTMTPSCDARFRQRIFCAAPVMNIAEDPADAWSCEWTRNFPILPAVSPGSDPAVAESDLMIGTNIPPARAVVDGIAGDSSVSDMASPYPRPRLLLPNQLTNITATRLPSPVFSKPSAKKNEMTINQMTSFVKAAKAAWNERMFVTATKVRQEKAQAPTGSGSRTRPAMVVTNTDSRRQA